MKRPRENCHWCGRRLEAPSVRSSLAKTQDHVIPKSSGGTSVVPCCRACNHIKADLLPADWDRWRAQHPEWWRIYPRHTAKTYFRPVQPGAAS